MLKKILKGLAISTIALLGASPASAAIITHEEVHIQYTWEEFFGAADGKEFQVQIRGNPFVMQDEAFRQTVLTKLQKRSVGPRTTWTAQSETGGQPDQYRLVLVFGASNQLGQTLCGQLATLNPPSAKVAGSVQVAAAYCRGDQPMTEAYARTDAVSPDDKAFGSLFSELMPVLFPRRPGLRLDQPIFRRD